MSKVITVKVFPNAGKDEVKEKEGGALEVRVRAKPKNNEATIAVMELLAKHYRVPFSAVRLVQGKTSRNKVFEIGI